MALSGNGRYLYVGLSDAPAVHRIDLSTTPPTSVRIPLSLDQNNSPGYATDLEPLDGDGTSFLVTTLFDQAAAVFDGSVRRQNRTTTAYSVRRLERTATPGIFFATGNSDATRLSVSASGVGVTRAVSNFMGSSLQLRGDLGVVGEPCLDFAAERAHLVSGNTLRSFSTATGTSTGNLPLPVTLTGDWAQACVRWGLDGFAILGNDKLFIARWSQAIPAGADLNGNGVSDAWEAAHFGGFTFDADGDPDADGVANALEYLFGGPPLGSSINPFQLLTDAEAEPDLFRIVFPRRTGLLLQSYVYETSADLGEWASPAGVTETVLSTQTVSGVVFETIEALGAGAASDGRLPAAAVVAPVALWICARSFAGAKCSRPAEP